MGDENLKDGILDETAIFSPQEKVRWLATQKRVVENTSFVLYRRNVVLDGCDFIANEEIYRRNILARVYDLLYNAYRRMYLHQLKTNEKEFERFKIATTRLLDAALFLKDHKPVSFDCEEIFNLRKRFEETYVIDRKMAKLEVQRAWVQLSEEYSRFLGVSNYRDNGGSYKNTKQGYSCPFFTVDRHQEAYTLIQEYVKIIDKLPVLINFDARFDIGQTIPLLIAGRNWISFLLDSKLIRSCYFISNRPKYSSFILHYDNKGMILKSNSLNSLDCAEENAIVSIDLDYIISKDIPEEIDESRIALVVNSIFRILRENNIKPSMVIVLRSSDSILSALEWRARARIESCFLEFFVEIRRNTELENEAQARQKVLNKATLKKIKEEDNAKISIVLGNKLRTFTLYRWVRIFDSILFSLDKESSSLKGMVKDIESFRFSNNCLSKIQGFMNLVKDSRLEEKKESFRRLLVAKEFIGLGRVNLAVESMQAVALLIRSRIADIESMRERLFKVRKELLTLSKNRLERVQGAIREVTAGYCYSKDSSYLKQSLFRLFRWPFLGEPDFIGVRNQIKRLGIIVNNLQKNKARGLLFERLKLIESILSEALLENEFTTDYRNKVKSFSGRLEEFDVLFKEWAVKNSLIRGSPRYWRARLFKALFISEKSPCFAACDTMLLVIKVTNFRLIIHSLIKNNRSNLLGFILGFLKSNPDMHCAKDITGKNRNQFLMELIANASSDFNLLEKAKAEDIVNLYKAFLIKFPGK
jgi:hypothetical protein